MGDFSKSSQGGSFFQRMRGRQPQGILWGRVAILGVALLLAFSFGRASAPNAGEELDQTDRELAAARAEVKRLEERLRTTKEAPSTPDPSATLAASPGASPGPGQGSRTYVVKDGDTLWSIAKRFYGDASLGSFLAQVNNLPNGDDLSIGQQLVIPPKPQKP